MLRAVERKLIVEDPDAVMSRGVVTDGDRIAQSMRPRSTARRDSRCSRARRGVIVENHSQLGLTVVPVGRRTSISSRVWSICHIRLEIGSSVHHN